MVAIRNRNTNVPHVFRYPLWEEGIFYPNGSLAAREVKGYIDSDNNYFNYYGALRDIQPGSLPPESNNDWTLVFDGAREAKDSEILERLVALELEHDSDIRRTVHDFLKNDSDFNTLIASFFRDSDLFVTNIFFGDNDSEGVLSWNENDQTLEIAVNSEVTIQLGQEQVFYGKATEAISNGEAVMFAGAQGDHLLFRKADVTVPFFRQEWIIGVATQNLANNQFGFVTTQGKVRDLNTNNFSEGALLYLDPTQAGRLIDSEPPEPNYQILMAAVTRSHQNHGTIYVRPTFNHKLEQLQDVVVQNVTQDELLVWIDSEQIWANQSLNELLGDTFDYGNF